MYIPTHRECFRKSLPVRQHLADLMDIHPGLPLDFTPVAERGFDLDGRLTCKEASELTEAIMRASGLKKTLNS